MPLTLGFDTSAGHVGAALVRDGKVLANILEYMTRGQAERLMPMLEEVLASQNADWKDLQRIGVGIGPGNFTGIRISVSAARGLSMSLGIPAIGVSTINTSRLAQPGRFAPLSMRAGIMSICRILMRPSPIRAPKSTPFQPCPRRFLRPSPDQQRSLQIRAKLSNPPPTPRPLPLR